MLQWPRLKGATTDSHEARKALQKENKKSELQLQLSRIANVFVLYS